MRDLTVVEIEMVSGAGFAEWWGGVTESIQQWMGTIQAFFQDAPRPTTNDIQNIQNLCGPGGVQSLTMSQTGSSTSLTIAGPAGSITYTQGGGSFSATCFPAGGEQG